MKILRYDSASSEQKEVILRAKRYDIIRGAFFLMFLPTCVGIMGLAFSKSTLGHILFGSLAISVLWLMSFIGCVFVYLWKLLHYKYGNRLTPIGTLTDFIHDFMCTRPSR